MIQKPFCPRPLAGRRPSLPEPLLRCRQHSPADTGLLLHPFLSISRRRRQKLSKANVVADQARTYCRRMDSFGGNHFRATNAAAEWLLYSKVTTENASVNGTILFRSQHVGRSVFCTRGRRKFPSSGWEAERRRPRLYFRPKFCNRFLASRGAHALPAAAG